MRVTSLLLASLILSTLVPACVYDHRVTQAIMERRRRAKQAEGAEIRASGAVATPPRHIGRVRFFVAADYRAQHPAWKQDLEYLLDDANALLLPEFGVRLDVAEFQSWSPRCERAQLSSCIEELAGHEVSPGGEWVVGVLGAEPRFIESFDDLGMAPVPGSHFVIRDISDPKEREAIDRVFATFTQERRDEIYKSRKKHKRLAVFLHEWAHTLGGLHTSARDALLRPVYDDQMKAFDVGNAGLIAAALGDRFSQDPEHHALLGYLESTPTPELDPGAREALVTRLKQLATREEPEAQSSAVAMREHPYVVTGPDATLLAELGPEERKIYHVALLQLFDDNLSGALSTLLPLIQRFEGCYAVQHLGCSLAMRLGRAAEANLACPRMQNLRRPE